MEKFCRVVLDTNFMLIPFQFSVDIKAELDRILDFNYRIYTLDGVLKELEVLSKEKGQSGRAAKASLEMAKDFPTLTANGDIDDTLLRLASNDTIICTNDRILKEKIKRKGAPVIYLRQKKYLMID
ncbi:MAG: PIN domain-containing protein [Candidatus Hydrothermarchaeaceae archaeon]|jgi:rRNA-processing protein FCF1